MDVGADNFRFTLEDQNGRKMPVQTVRPPATTELHIDSLDRYLPSMLQSNGFFQNYPSQILAKVAGPILLNSSISGTECKIQTARPLAYGYYSRVALTQMFLNLKLPTFVAGYNNLLSIETGTTPTASLQTRLVSIPPGYYTYDEAATAITAGMQVYPELAAATCVAPNGIVGGFTFSTNNVAVYMSVFFGIGAGTSQDTQINIGRTARTLGLNRATFGFSPDINTTGQPLANNTLYLTATGGVPNFLPTDYVDIVSSSLTNYKDAKDGNSTLASPGAVMGRIWLTESAVNVATTPNTLTTTGANPISVMKSWVNPNWCQWSPNQTINSIDITLLDMWGQVLPWSSTFATEWSATLTLTE